MELSFVNADIFESNIFKKNWPTRYFNFRDQKYPPIFTVVNIKEMYNKYFEYSHNHIKSLYNSILKCITLDSEVPNKSS